MPETSCFPIADSVSFEEAVISEPFAIGYYATKLAGSLKNKTIGILGFGPIGMSVLLPALVEKAAGPDCQCRPRAHERQQIPHPNAGVASRRR